MEIWGKGKMFKIVKTKKTSNHQFEKKSLNIKWEQKKVHEAKIFLREEKTNLIKLESGHYGEKILKPGQKKLWGGKVTTSDKGTTLEELEKDTAGVWATLYGRKAKTKTGGLTL